MFKKPVNMAQQGDRIGLCVTQFEASQLERGLVSTPGYLPTVFGAIVTIRRISYYKCKILVCIAALYHRIMFECNFFLKTLLTFTFVIFYSGYYEQVQISHKHWP